MSADEVADGIDAMKTMFRRMGIMWRLVKGTVFNVSTNTPTLTLVTLDGDDDPSNCISMVGQISVGARVYVMVVPPQGNYIVGIGSGGLRTSAVELATATSNVNLTAASQLVPGTPITLVVPPGAFFEADIRVDIEKIGTNTATLGFGELFLDGVLVNTTFANYRSTSAVAGDRATVSQQYGPTAVSAGSHTWDIRGRRIAGADSTLRINLTHTTLKVRLLT